MAVRSILHYPDKRLRIPAEQVTDFGPDFQVLIDDMAETMYAAPGVGLAAPQIGVALRVFVVDTATGEDEPSDFRVFANPEIVQAQGECIFTEGCLSFPGAREDIERAEVVTCKAQDRHGNWFEITVDGLLAIAIQHEKDHLDGKLMIDRLGMLRKRLLHRQMLKRAGSEASA